MFRVKFADIPIAVVFSVAQSRFVLPAQAIFLATNLLGLSLGAVYHTNTPDLYENNAHHTMGWIFTWFVLAWILLGVINTYAARFSHNERFSGGSMISANSACYQRLQCEQFIPEQRWSQDSTHRSELNFDTFHSSDLQSTTSENKPYDDVHAIYNSNDTEEETCPSKLRGFLNLIHVERFLVKNIHRLSLERVLATSKVIYIVLERVLVILAFIVLTTGIVTFGGIFVSLFET
jgi:hypothetical protein